MKLDETIRSYYLRLSYNDMISTSFNDKLKVKFIFWIRFEVLFKDNILHIFQW
jgi:hypothetical protein